MCDVCDMSDVWCVTMHQIHRQSALSVNDKRNTWPAEEFGLPECLPSRQISF